MIYTLTIKDGKNFRFTDAAFAPEDTEAHDMMVMEGEYETKDNIITLHYQKHGWITKNSYKQEDIVRE